MCQRRNRPQGRIGGKLLGRINLVKPSDTPEIEAPIFSFRERSLMKPLFDAVHFVKDAEFFLQGIKPGNSVSCNNPDEAIVLLQNSHNLVVRQSGLGIDVMLNFASGWRKPAEATAVRSDVEHSVTRIVNRGEVFVPKPVKLRLQLSIMRKFIGRAIIKMKSIGCCNPQIRIRVFRNSSDLSSGFNLIFIPGNCSSL